jgi:protein-disulfide isomerase
MNSKLLKTIPPSKLRLPVAGRDHLQGPIDAPVTLLEYGDYQCPFCGEAFYTVKAVQAELGEQLCFAFRNFPLTNVHPYAEHAAEAAEAASAWSCFWQMHDMLFENQQSLDDEHLAQYGLALGLDPDRLMADIVSGAHLERIREDFQAGARGDVNGTPAFFINGIRYEGGRSLEELLVALTDQDQKPS